MVELIIENQSVELYPSEVISLEMAINDMASIESRNGAFSNQFNIPSTADNNRILGYPSELNFVSGFKPSKSRNSSININGLAVQTGIIQVEQYDAKDKSFSVSFFSGNTEWNDEIADKNLRDIVLDKYNHLYLPAVIAASMNNTSGYIYPFINYGRYNTLNNNNTELINWMPAMYTHTLVREMFNDIGWKVGGGIFKDPVFLKHILPFSLQEIERQPSDVSKIGMGAGGASGLYNTGVTIIYPFVFTGNGLGDYNPATGVYTASQTFNASVYASFFRTIIGINLIEIRKNGVVQNSTLANSVAFEFPVIAGDTITVTLSSPNTSPASDARRNLFTIVPNDVLIEGMNIEMSSTLPDISQESFINTLFNQFGILFTSDNISKTVYLNTFENIKNNIKNAIDWTDKIDLSKDIEIDYTELVSDYGRKNTYTYNKNEDSKNSIYGANVKPNGGDGSFEIDSDFLSKEEDLFDSEFVSSTNTKAFLNTTRLMFIPRWKDQNVPANEPDVDPLPRCALCVNEVSVSQLFSGITTSINIVGASGTSNVTQVPYAYFDNVRMGISKIDDVNQSLSFGDNIKPKAHKNLIESYYEDFVSILNNPRKVTAYFLLNERDINNLDFLIPIYIGGELNSYFYINKISDYRPMNGGITKVELILIV